MRSPRVLLLVLLLAACHPAPPVSSAGAPRCPAVKGAHWGYEGEVAPEHWGDLDPQYALCRTGEAQSPVDLAGAVPDPALPRPAFRYRPGKATLVDNGHTVQ